MAINIFKKKKIIHSNLPLFFYRKHKNNLSKDKKKILKTRIKILNFFHRKFLKERDILNLKKTTEIQIKNFCKMNYFDLLKKKLLEEMQLFALLALVMLAAAF